MSNSPRMASTSSVPHSTPPSDYGTITPLVAWKLTQVIVMRPTASCRVLARLVANGLWVGVKIRELLSGICRAEKWFRHLRPIKVRLDHNMLLLLWLMLSKTPWLLLLWVHQRWQWGQTLITSRRIQTKILSRQHLSRKIRLYAYGLTEVREGRQCQFNRQKSRPWNKLQNPPLNQM